MSAPTIWVLRWRHECLQVPAAAHYGRHFPRYGSRCRYRFYGHYRYLTSCVRWIGKGKEMETTEKFWNFYDDWGMCVYSASYYEGDTFRGMSEWWNDFIKDEEYNPGASSVVLEDFNGEENQ